MKYFILSFVAVFAFQVSAAAQSSDMAKATYSKKGVLTGMTNLVSEQNCGQITVSGRISKVSLFGEGESRGIYFDIGVGRKSQTAEIDLERVSNADNSHLDTLVARGKRVKVVGYTCGSNGIISSISITSIR